MVETRCTFCGRRLRVTSLPAMCPKCRTPVSLPPSALENTPASLPEAQSVDSAQTYVYLWSILAIALGLAALIFGIDDLRLRIHDRGLVPAASVNSAPPAPIVIYAPPSSPVEKIAPPSVPAVATAVPIVPSASQPITSTTQPTPQPGPFAALASVHAFRVPPARTGLTDDQVGDAIRKGADYLISQFSGSRLKDADSVDAETFAGMDTLCVYALLHAGQALDDANLKPQATFMKALLDRVKTFPMNGNRATYSRSLRISALTMYNRPEDRDVIEADYAWLLKNVTAGSYSYDAVPEKQVRPPGAWDNSNSQYGALGVWSASEAGLRPLGTYWEEVTQHWENAQSHSGGWGYSPGAQNSTLSMTAAGVSILFAARDQTAADAGISEARPTPLSRSITLGLEWLDEADHAITLSNDHPGYTLYGLERAGLASGYKFFGSHDWFLELAQQNIKAQSTDGSWAGGDGGRVETAFSLLFLSRGRPPVFMSKLRFDGDWAFRPRDAANLTRFASHQLERQFNWQVVGLDRSALEWSDSPVLYISSSDAPNFSDADIGKLHDFVEAGGMLFTESDRNNDNFNRFAADLARRLFPSYELAPLPADHPLYSSMFLVNAPANALSAVSNGARLLMVHSTGDLSRHWNSRYEKTDPTPLQLGTNIGVYAAGRSNFRNRAQSINIPTITTAPLATVPIARIRYNGNWDPEPGAWKRMSRLMQFETGVLPATVEVDIGQLTPTTAPLAFLTGTNGVTFPDSDVAAVQKYLTAGGVLFIDPCGGSPAFTKSIDTNLTEKLTAAGETELVAAAHPLLNRTADGMVDLTSPKLRLFAHDTFEKTPFRCRELAVGKGSLIVCDVDVTSGLLGTNTWGISGYQSDYAEGLVKNLILWTMRHAGKIVAENPKPEIRNPNQIPMLK